MSSLCLTITAWSHTGRVRSANDDHYLYGPFVEQGALCQLVLPLSSLSLREHGFLCAVADGMGGYAGGALASRTVLETLAGFFYAQKRQHSTSEVLRATVEEALGHARNALQSHLRRDPQLSEAGTTIAGLAVSSEGFAIPFHIGDSRILRASGGFVRALTIDHTPVGQDVALGRMSEEDAAKLPIANQLTRSLGLEEQGAIEWGEPLELAHNDLFLLGTDGWHGLRSGLNSKAVRELLNDYAGDDQGLVRLLVEAAIAADGADNATLLVVRVTDTTISLQSGLPSQDDLGQTESLLELT